MSAPSSLRSGSLAPAMAQTVGSRSTLQTGSVETAARLRMARPADDARHAVTRLGDVQLHAAQRARRAVGAFGALVALQCLRAVVTGEEDEGVVAQLVVVEVLQELADGCIHLRDVAVIVPAVRVVLPGVQLEELLGGGDRLVRTRGTRG